MEMAIQQLEVTKKDLLALSKEERHFFLLLTNFSNELSILTKLIVYSGVTMERVHKDGLEPQALHMQIMFLQRLLAGKLHEGWEMLRKRFYGTQLSQKYRDDEELTGCLRRINRYFERKNLITYIRQNFAFHISDDQDALLKQFDSTGEEIILSSFLTGQLANTFHQGTEELQLLGMLSALPVSEEIQSPQQKMNVMHDDMLNITEGFRAFITIYLNVCFLRNFGVDINGKLKRVKASTLNLNVPNIKTISVPYFAFGDPREHEAGASN
jgi:hypothetical protein